MTDLSKPNTRCRKFCGSGERLWVLFLLLHASLAAQTGVLEKVFAECQPMFDTLDYGIVGLYRDREGVVHTAAAGWAAPGEKMTADRL